MINSGYMIFLKIKNKDVLLAPNYNGYEICGFDIAIIGISKQNNLKLQKYIDLHEKNIKQADLN